jgi:alkylhydroperoxidase family enzyme
MAHRARFAVKGSMADPLFLPDVEAASRQGPAGERMRQMEARGMEVPPIHLLLSFKPDMAEHLNRFTQAAMRGPSPLPPGVRELIAAFTSSQNQCLF